MTEREVIEYFYNVMETGNIKNDMQQSAYEVAVAALEKQIPRNPIHDGLYACPNCHTIMLQGAFEARGKCCKECGQALDWGENSKD